MPANTTTRAVLLGALLLAGCDGGDLDDKDLSINLSGTGSASATPGDGGDDGDAGGTTDGGDDGDTTDGGTATDWGTTDEPDEPDEPEPDPDPVDYEYAGGGWGTLDRLYGLEPTPESACTWAHDLVALDVADGCWDCTFAFTFVIEPADARDTCGVESPLLDLGEVPFGLQPSYYGSPYVMYGYYGFWYPVFAATYDGGSVEFYRYDSFDDPYYYYGGGYYFTSVWSGTLEVY